MERAEEKRLEEGKDKRDMNKEEERMGTWRRRSYGGQVGRAVPPRLVGPLCFRGAVPLRQGRAGGEGEAGQRYGGTEATQHNTGTLTST